MSETFDPDWREKGACLDEDQRLFFPEAIVDAGEQRVAIETAKAICRRCEVLESCLQYAVDNDKEVGIYGAKTRQERLSQEESGDNLPKPLIQEVK